MLGANGEKVIFYHHPNLTYITEQMFVNPNDTRREEGKITKGGV